MDPGGYGRAAQNRVCQHYGAVRTTDWRTFEDITAQVSFPADHRHGTVVKISEELARRLEARRPEPTLP
jgi:hypothetical protein